MRIGLISCFQLTRYLCNQKLTSVSESNAIRSWLADFEKNGGIRNKQQYYELTFSRSSGPGGQNVQKVSTKATLRFDLAAASSWLHSHVIANLLHDTHYAQSTHSLVVTSTQHRTQPANAQDCLDKLQNIIVCAAKQGLVGETSMDKRQHVKQLIRIDKARTKADKIRAHDKKAGRSKTNWE